MMDKVLGHKESTCPSLVRFGGSFDSDAYEDDTANIPKKKL